MKKYKPSEIILVRAKMTATDSNIIGEISEQIPSSFVTGGTHYYHASVERLSKADPKNVQEIAASQIQLLIDYHKEVLNQAKKSFLWALIAAGIGLIFFLIAMTFVVFRQSTTIAILGGIGGALIEFISGINFYLYGKTSSQMADFQQRLDRTQRYLLANSICEGLDNDFKQKSRSELIQVIASISRNHDTSENVSDSQKKD